MKNIVLIGSILLSTLGSAAHSEITKTCERLRNSTTVLPSRLHDFRLVDKENHSMATALPVYVCQKIPCKLIENAVKQNGRIIIIGAPPEILEQCSQEFGLPNLEDGISMQIPEKKENIYRPIFATGNNGRDVFVSVMAGEDYIKQVSAMIGYQIQFNLNRNPDDVIEIKLFPSLEEDMANWTHLSKFIRPDETVVIGNVYAFNHYLNQLRFENQAEITEDSFYKSIRINFPSRTVNLLITKHTFWGNMAGTLVKQMIKEGVKEIIYISKVATFENPRSIYNTVYVPTEVVLSRNGRAETIEDFENSIAKFAPEHKTGRHLSIATVMEQDYHFSDMARSLGVVSLDLEVANIAKEISAFNQISERKVKFGSIHFATDHIREKNEAELDTGFDLSNSRSEHAKELKKNILNRIHQILFSYLNHKAS